MPSPCKVGLKNNFFVHNGKTYKRTNKSKVQLSALSSHRLMLLLPWMILRLRLSMTIFSDHGFGGDTLMPFSLFGTWRREP